MPATLHTLHTDKISKHYKRRCVVNELSISVKSGEVTGVLGPNGAGKTTSFYLLVGLEKCDAGNIYLDDINITRFSISKRAHIGITYLPQETSVFRKLSVEENILAILELQKQLSKKNRLERCQQLISEFNLGSVKHDMGITLSGGERRRVEIARTMATHPKFILLDEPFAGIDPLAIADIKRMIRKVANQGVGILITDHNVYDTLSICDHAVVIAKGRVLAQGKANTIINNAEVKSAYLGEHFVLNRSNPNNKEPS